MPGQLTQFRIEALHQSRTIHVSITDNKLVLVGENGTGKSTVANLIYFFLTNQWRRMLDYEFDAVVAVIDSEEIVVTREELTAFRDHRSSRNRLFQALPASFIRRIDLLLRSTTPEQLLTDRDVLDQLSDELGVSSSVVEHYLLLLVAEESPVDEKRNNITQTIALSKLNQVLYLPTYRRIEQDLRSIFPGSENEFDHFRERMTRKTRNISYIELVEFGMEDVEKTIQRRMAEIKDDVRNGLNNLTGNYLRDVIRGDYESANLAVFGGLNETTINAIFSRIDESILPTQDQSRLRRIITKINRDKSVEDDEKVVVHFLTRLINLYETQQHNESDVQEFVRVCNLYLVGKKIVYDNVNFNISIHESTPDSRYGKDNLPKQISLKMLSSGEKQIVSLFSHIYLTKGSGYFVIIDEPELSLSVPWQKRFLPDILETGRCNGLIAVTHSPFIFDNQLDKYTHSLEEFMEPFNVIS
ncbi:MAG TPA: AAA family ATPase [Herpetosiphonaceae bacterium]